MTFDEFMQQVHANFALHGGQWRFGQTIVNVLSKVRPDLAEQMLGSEVDCFYLDAMVPGYLHNLSEIW